MDFLIPGNPGRPGTTLNVAYCSDVTVTIVELSAANYTFIMPFIRARFISLLSIG